MGDAAGARGIVEYTINKIIEMLIKIKKGELDEFDRLQRLLKEKQDKVLDNLADPKKP